MVRENLKIFIATTWRDTFAKRRKNSGCRDVSGYWNNWRRERKPVLFVEDAEERGDDGEGCATYFSRTGFGNSVQEKVAH